MFEFTSSIFFWSILNFFILLALVYKLALPSLFQMVEANAKKKQDLIDSLEAQQKESEKLLND